MHHKIFIDVIVSIILVIIISLALTYIIKAKKRGDKCIGCPYAKQCGGKCDSESNSEKKS